MLVSVNQERTGPEVSSFIHLQTEVGERRPRKKSATLFPRGAVCGTVFCLTRPRNLIFGNNFFFIFLFFLIQKNEFKLRHIQTAGRNFT